jgi:hypothetical protein
VGEALVGDPGPAGSQLATPSALPSQPTIPPNEPMPAYLKKIDFILDDTESDMPEGSATYTWTIIRGGAGVSAPEVTLLVSFQRFMPVYTVTLW